jgi:hypothetical protein
MAASKNSNRITSVIMANETVLRRVYLALKKICFASFTIAFRRQAGSGTFRCALENRKSATRLMAPPSLTAR